MLFCPRWGKDLNGFIFFKLFCPARANMFFFKISETLQHVIKNLTRCFCAVLPALGQGDHISGFFLNLFSPSRAIVIFFKASERLNMIRKNMFFRFIAPAWAKQIHPIISKKYQKKTAPLSKRCLKRYAVSPGLPPQLM